MGSFFSYESKPMQLMMFLGDLVLLNLLYLLFCLPIFTIGAAQAGLFTACKVLLDKEDDSSPYAAFWRGFTTGFRTVTLAWGVMTLVLIVVIYGAITAVALGSPAWLVILAVAFCMIFQVLVPAFHARMGCTWWQLIRNSWFMLFAHPLRSILTTAVISAPGIYFCICLYNGAVYDFLSLTLIWVVLYFSTAFCFATGFLKKPFNVLREHYNETHGLDKDGNPLPPAAETDANSEGEYFDEEDSCEKAQEASAE